MSTHSHIPATQRTDLAGVVAMIPGLLGFVPESSVVLLFLDSSLVKLTMRVDLDEIHRPELPATIQTAAHRAKADEVVVVGFVPRIGQNVAETLRELAIRVERDALAADRVLTVRSMAMVGSTAWSEVPAWGVLPVERPVSEVEHHSALAEQVWRGKAPLASRSELARLVEPGSQPAPEGFEDGLREAAAHIADLADDERVALVAAILDDHEVAVADGDAGTGPDGRTLGWLVALVSDEALRDVATTRVNRKSAKDWIAFWANVVRLTSGDACATPLALASLAAWVSGDGALASIAVDHALEIQPDHHLARLVRAAVVACMPPSAWDEVLSVFAGSTLVDSEQEPA